MPTQPNQPGVLAREALAAAHEADNSAATRETDARHVPADELHDSHRHRVRVKHRRRRLRMPWERERNGLLWLLLTLAIAAMMAYSMLHYLELL